MPDNVLVTLLWRSVGHLYKINSTNKCSGKSIWKRSCKCLATDFEQISRVTLEVCSSDCPHLLLEHWLLMSILPFFRRCYFGSSNKLVSLLTRNLESEHLHNSIEATQLCWCLPTCKLYGICRLSNSPPLPGTIGFLEAMLFISFLFFGPSWKKKLNEGKRSRLILTAVTWPWQLLFRLPVNGSECPTSSTFYVTGSLFTEAKQTTLRSQLLLSDSLVFGKVADSRPSHQI